MKIEAKGDVHVTLHEATIGPVFTLGDGAISVHLVDRDGSTCIAYVQVQEAAKLEARLREQVRAGYERTKAALAAFPPQLEGELEVDPAYEQALADHALAPGESVAAAD